MTLQGGTAAAIQQVVTAEIDAEGSLCRSTADGQPRPGGHRNGDAQRHAACLCRLAFPRAQPRPASLHYPLAAMAIAILRWKRALIPLQPCGHAFGALAVAAVLALAELQARPREQCRPSLGQLLNCGAPRSRRLRLLLLAPNWKQPQHANVWSIVRPPGIEREMRSANQSIQRV